MPAVVVVWLQTQVEGQIDEGVVKDGVEAKLARPWLLAWLRATSDRDAVDGGWKRAMQWLRTRSRATLAPWSLAWSRATFPRTRSRGGTVPSVVVVWLQTQVEGRIAEGVWGGVVRGCGACCVARWLGDEVCSSVACGSAPGDGVEMCACAAALGGSSGA